MRAKSIHRISGQSHHDASGVQISHNIPLHPFPIIPKFPYQHLLIAIMADERSPLLQNGREHDGEIEYSAINEPEQADSVAIHGSTDAEAAEQQQTVVAPQSSVITLVRLGNFLDYVFYSNNCFLDKGDTNGNRDILKCDGPNDYCGLCVTYLFTLFELGEVQNLFPDSICFYWKRVE